MPASELHAAPIAIVGNLNVDQVVRTVDRYPAWDEEIVVDSSRLELAGTAGYLLLALLGLGIDPFVVSTIGDDPFGAFLEGELARLGADASGIEVLPDFETCLGIIFVGTGGKRAIMTTLGAHALMDEGVAKRHDDLIAACPEVFLCGTYLLPRFGPVAAQRYAEFLRARGQIVAFDPSWDPKGWGEHTRRQTLDLLSAVDVYLPNDTELMHLTGQTSWEAALDVVAGIAGETILKRGADGAVYARDQERIAVPGFPVDAVNTVGAGDVFDAAYLYGRRIGWPPADRLHSPVPSPQWSSPSPASGTTRMPPGSCGSCRRGTMSLATTRDLLRAAQSGGYAVPAFNVIGVEHAEGIVLGAEDAHAPVILQLSENAVKYHLGAVEPIGRACAEIAHATVPISLHLDHATTIDLCARAVSVGFLLGHARCFQLAVRRERGPHRGTGRMGSSTGRGCRSRTRHRWWQGRGSSRRGRVDRSRAGDNLCHGDRRGCPRRGRGFHPRHARAHRPPRSRPLERIRAAVIVPLVLHGSSGVSDADLAAAATRGIVKINLATQLNIAFTAAIRQHLAESPDVVDPRPT